jgi:chemotaxis protein methyltransferase CheR
MIYFAKETRQALINIFFNCLKTGGYLLLGHAESLNGMNHRFRYIQPNIYQK